RRIDATIAALKSAGVPVMWVGLPSQRGTKASADSSYLNELYRSRAEKAGIVYVDIWDGFVDEAGRYSAQGPDYEGQIRRLRSGRAAPAADATASRVLTKGETVAAPTGRADDFSWPRGSVLNVQPSAADLAAAPPAAPATAPNASDAKPTKPDAGQRTSDST